MLDNFRLLKTKDTKADQARIDSFCGRIGVQLPNDYQAFLASYNGVIFDSRLHFHIPQIDEYAELYTLYGFDFDNPQGTNLESAYDYNFNYDMDGSTLAIGHCSTGNGGLFILLVTRDDMSGIYACDLFHDDFVYAASSVDSNTFKIAVNFTEFISKLEYRQ